jgi:hypothetical protein
MDRKNRKAQKQSETKYLLENKKLIKNSVRKLSYVFKFFLLPKPGAAGSIPAGGALILPRISTRAFR